MRTEGVSDEIRGILSAMAERTGANGAVFLAFGRNEDSPVVREVIATGECEHWNKLLHQVPPLGFASDYSDPAHEMRRGQWCLQGPAERHENQFCWDDEDFAHIARWRQTPAYVQLYRPQRSTFHLRSILVRAGIVVGWCAFFFEQVRNRRVVKTKLDEIVPTLRSKGFELLQQNRSSWLLIVNESGALIAASHALVSSPDYERLKEIAREGSRRAEDRITRWTSGGFEVAARALSGLFGAMTIVAARQFPELPTDRFLALTEAQRQIACLFAEGLTTNEIAVETQLARSTVKYHLKNIYEVLHVSSQVELVTLMHNRPECESKPWEAVKI